MTGNPLEQLAAINPQPADADPPTGAVTATAVLRDIERRCDMRTRQRPTVTSTEPRWGVWAAVAAFAVVIIIGVIAALAATGGSGDPADEPPPVTTTLDTAPTTTTPQTTSTPPQSTTTTGVSAGELSASELLSIDDLPEPSDWQLFDDAADEGIAGWGNFDHGVLAIQCGPVDGAVGPKYLGAWRLDPGPQAPDPDDPWQYLDESLFRAMFTENAIVGEALYFDAPHAVMEAFEMMKAVTLGCVEGGFATQVETRELDLPDLGDDSLAIEAKAPLGNPGGKWDVFDLAIIRDSDRLLIVEHHETIAARDATPRVTDTQFLDIVQTATDRLKRPAATDMLVRVEDLPAGYGWLAQPYGDEHLDPALTAGIVMHLCSGPVEGDGLWKLATVPPLSELSSGGPAAAFFTGDRIALEELVFNDTSAKIKSAFDATLVNLEHCIESSGRDPTYGFTPSYVEDGWHFHKERVELDLGSVDAYAVRYYAADGDDVNASSGWMMDHTIAMVRRGGQLILIEVFQDSAENGIGAAEFTDIVAHALDRVDTTP
jgi:hypothetical protein